MIYNPGTGEVSYTATDVRGLEAQNFPLQADAALAQSLGEDLDGPGAGDPPGLLCSLGIAFGFPAVC